MDRDRRKCDLNSAVHYVTLPKSSLAVELIIGQWIFGHGSNGSTDMDGSHGSWVSIRDPLTHE